MLPTWHNAVLPEDVNEDEVVSILDLLALVTFLREHTVSFVLPAPTPQFGPAPYVDVDDDGIYRWLLTCWTG